MLRNEQSKMVQTLNDGPFCDKKSSADTKTIQNEDETEKKDTVDQPQSFWFTNIIYLVLLGVMIRVAGTFLEMDLRSLDQDVLDPKLSPFEKEGGNRTGIWKNFSFILSDERIRSSLWLSLICMCGFWLIHFTSRFFWRLFLTRENYYRFSVSDRIALAEKICSTVHALIVGLSSIQLVFLSSAWADENIVTHHPTAVDWVLSISIGYELYDLVAMAIQRTDPLGMWLHHFGMIIGFSACIVTTRASFICVLLLVTELTCIPSNFHWYLKTVLKARNSIAFHFNQKIRFLSFVILRTWTVPYVFYRIHSQQETFFHQHWIVISIGIIVPTLLGCLNMWWTYQMHRLYRKRRRMPSLWPEKYPSVIEKWFSY